jgi:hypothetical protein
MHSLCSQYILALLMRPCTLIVHSLHSIYAVHLPSEFSLVTRPAADWGVWSIFEEFCLSVCLFVPRVCDMMERPNQKSEVNGPSRGRSIDPKKIFKMKTNLPQVDEIAKMAKWRKW